MSLLREIIFVATVCCTNLLSLAALGNTIVILPFIGRDFGIAASPGQLSWTVAAYSLTVGTFILPAGKWGDLYGHKRMIVIGYLWFAIWSLIAGFSRLVSFRLVLFPSYPDVERNRLSRPSLRNNEMSAK